MICSPQGSAESSAAQVVSPRGLRWLGDAPSSRAGRFMVRNRPAMYTVRLTRNPLLVIYAGGSEMVSQPNRISILPTITDWISAQLAGQA